VSTNSYGQRNVTGPSALPVNTWTHLAGTYDGTTLRLYVNGTLVASQAASGTITTSTGAVRLGGNAVWGEYFRGRIDDVRIFNRALSQAEVQTDMNTGAGGVSDTVPPTVPSNPRATVAGTGRIDVSWTASTDNVGVKEYRVERCAGAAGTVCSNFGQVAVV